MTRIDVWLTPKEACKALGEEWHIEGNYIVRRVANVVLASRRIFDGTEHPMAKAGLVVFDKKELE